jgi:TPP-dependent pyruvate/acetoin dehydrogenase alpha subunit
MKTVTLENSSGRPASYHPDFLLGLYERLVLIREFEERVKFLFLEGGAERG